jgi:hypothetical protein
MVNLMANYGTYSWVRDPISKRIAKWVKNAVGVVFATIVGIVIGVCRAIAGIFFKLVISSILGYYLWNWVGVGVLHGSPLGLFQVFGLLALGRIVYYAITQK